MVVQLDLNLNKPLEASTESKINRVPLSPSLATLALTLHGDYYRQLQSKCNSRIVRDPLLLLVLLTLFVSFTAYLYADLYEVSDSFGEFFHLAWQNKFKMTNYFPALIIVAGIVGLTVSSITDEFRTISDLFNTDAYMAQVFRFPLRIYANATEAEMEMPLVTLGSQSTDLVVYRGSPIAIVTVVPDPEKSDSLTFYAKITGLHVRKVYSKAGLETELLGYAQEKARELCIRYAKDNNLNSKKLKIVLVAEAYSFDNVLPKLYLQNDFKLVKSSYKINAFEKEEKNDKVFLIIPLLILYKHFAIQRFTYEQELKN